MTKKEQKLLDEIVEQRSLLRKTIKILSKEKIKTISSLTFNPELSLKKGNFTITKPNKENNKDIN